MKKAGDKRQAAEQIWLGYFNRVLFEQGVINEAERNKLAVKIDNRRPGTVAK